MRQILVNCLLKWREFFAFRQAMEAACPVLLEPVMRVEVETPDEYQGDIIGDLNRRRGNIVDVNKKTAFTSIVGQVPLSEMFGYSTAVRSLSKGRASYSMEPGSFDPVPTNILRSILETSKSRLCAQLNYTAIMSTPRIRIRLKGLTIALLISPQLKS